MDDFLNLRVGQGIDVHAFVPGQTGVLKLACLEWPNQPLLEGHSDADVAAHAACDALLSASSLGDLGSVFGVADPRWAGASGTQLLEHVGSLLHSDGWKIINVVVQIIGNKPRLAPRQAEANDAISAALNGANITVSATTTDHLGFLGRGEGLAAVSTALLIKSVEQANL